MNPQAYNPTWLPYWLMAMACEPIPKVLVTLTLYMLKLFLWMRSVPLASSEPAVLAGIPAWMTTWFAAKVLVSVVYP